MTGHRLKIGQLVRYYPKWRVSIDTVSGPYQIIKRLPPADDGECQYEIRSRTAQSGRKAERVNRRLKLCGTGSAYRAAAKKSGINYPWPLTSDEPCYSPRRELQGVRQDEAAAKSENPNADPRKKHSPHCPHSPK